MLFSKAKWALPLCEEKHRALIERVVENHEFRCCFCHFQVSSTDKEPIGRMKVCPSQEAGGIEASQCFAFCAICWRFGSIKSLMRPNQSRNALGRFVELPSIKQSELVSTLRILYCTDMIMKNASAMNKQELRKSPIFQKGLEAKERLERIPPMWKGFDFNGEPEKLEQVVRRYSGYNNDGSSPYIGKLRFYFYIDHFVGDIEFWSKFIEAEL